MNRHILFAALAVFAISNESNALEVFGNGGDRSSAASGAGVSFGFSDSLATPFRTGGTTELNLVEGAWVLVGRNTSDTANFNVRIYADDGTNGGPTGSAVATGSSSRSAGTGTEWIYVSFGTPVQLSANSNYYLAMIKTTGTIFEFEWSVPTTSPSYTDLGSGSGYSLTSGGTVNLWNGSGGSSWSPTLLPVASNLLGYQIVPEPSTYALAGIAAVALGIVVRPKKPVSA